MSNRFLQYVEGDNQPSNAFARQFSTPVDLSEQETIGKSRADEATESFGFVDFGRDFGAGLANSIASTPQIIGGTLVEAGELAQGMEGKSTGEVIKMSFMKRVTDTLMEEESPGLIDAVQVIWGVEKDALLSLFSDGKAPTVIANSGYAMIEQNKAALKSMGLMPKGDEHFAFDVGQGFGQMAFTIGSTFVAKNPAVATAYMTSLINSQDYIEAREQGKDPEEAAGIAAASAYGQGLIEFMGGRVFLAASTGSTFLRRVLVRSTGQSVEEGAQGVVEETVKGATGVRTDTMEEKLARIGYQAMLGFIVGAPISTVLTRIEDAGRKEGLSKEQIDSIKDNLVANKDQVIDAATVLIDKEASGLSTNPQAQQQAQEAVKGILAKENAISDAEKSGTTQDPQIAAEVILRGDQPQQVKEAVREAMKAERQLTMDELQRIVEENTPPAMTVEASSAEAIKTNQQDVLETDNPGGSWLAGHRERADQQYLEGQKISGPVTAYTRTVEFPTEEAAKIPGSRGEKRQPGEAQYDALLEKVKKEGFKKDSPILIGINHKGEPYIIEGNTRVAVAKELGIDTIPAEVRYYAGGEMQSGSLTPEMLRKFIKQEPPKRTEKSAIYQQVLDADKERGTGLAEKAKEAVSDLGRMVGAALTPISTRLKNINPKLKTRLREFEFRRNQQINADQEAVTPFLEKYAKLSREDRVMLDFAMKNGDVDVINEIANANKMEAEIAAIRDALNGLYKRAEKAGLEIGYIKNYFPRYVTKPEALLNYFQGTEAWNEISAAIADKERETGRPLTTEDKAHLINTLLRGYKTAQITLSRPGALKERRIDQITPEINQFYGTTDQAILRYVSIVNDAIETRRFFGKGSKTDLIENIEDSIGFFVLQELEKGTINTTQAAELSDILRARFNRGQMGTFWRVYKNFSYIDTMGSPISAITQIGDLAFSLYKSGVYRTLSAAPRAIAGKSEITREDIGVTQIAEEFEGGSTSAKAVRKIFKLTGLEKMDAIGKETIINSALKRYQEQAKKPTKTFRESLEIIFEGETDQVISDLQNGVNSENVKLLLFNELLDLQPVALSEMPETYLRLGNGRILYMLKTFTIKQFDVYRNEIFNQIRTNPAQGLKNLTRLLAFFIMMNAGADFLKDLLLGRDTPPEDHVVNNIARVFGVGKYQIYSARREGAGTALVKTVAPPFKLIDSVTKDMDKAIRKGEFDPDNLKTIESIPLAGKFYYWWFGGGSELDKKKKPAFKTP